MSDSDRQYDQNDEYMNVIFDSGMKNFSQRRSISSSSSPSILRTKFNDQLSAGLQA